MWSQYCLLPFQLVNEEENQLQELKKKQYADLREQLLEDILRKGNDSCLSRRLQLEKHQEKLETAIFEVKFDDLSTACSVM